MRGWVPPAPKHFYSEERRVGAFLLSLWRGKLREELLSFEEVSTLWPTGRELAHLIFRSRFWGWGRGDDAPSLPSRSQLLPAAPGLGAPDRARGLQRLKDSTWSSSE